MVLVTDLDFFGAARLADFSCVGFTGVGFTGRVHGVGFTGTQHFVDSVILSCTLCRAF